MREQRAPLLNKKLGKLVKRLDFLCVFIYNNIRVIVLAPKQARNEITFSAAFRVELILHAVSSSNRSRFEPWTLMWHNSNHYLNSISIGTSTRLELLESNIKNVNDQILCGMIWFICFPSTQHQIFQNVMSHGFCFTSLEKSNKYFFFFQSFFPPYLIIII
ncbi:hypothetical protein ACJX0J_020232, partial [Zea mays]